MGHPASLRIEFFRSLFRAFSVLLFTVETDLCCLPPLNQKAIQGWGTQSFVNTWTENALTRSLSGIDFLPFKINNLQILRNYVCC
jgi:hypothetical protein